MSAAGEQVAGGVGAGRQACGQGGGGHGARRHVSRRHATATSPAAGGGTLLGDKSVDTPLANTLLPGPPPTAPPLSDTSLIESVPPSNSVSPEASARQAESSSSSSADDMNTLISTLIKTPSDSSTLELLTQMLRPIILSEALKYRTSLPYDTDDYIQEGRILIWKIALRGKYRRGSFKRYFGRAIRYRLSNVFRDYVLRNYVRVNSVSGGGHSSAGGYRGSRRSRGSSSAGFLDSYGNGYQVFVESDYAKNYRIKHREQCRRSYAKKKERLSRQSGVKDVGPGDEGT